VISTSSSCKLRARLTPPVPGRRLTLIPMICQRSMCILWVFSSDYIFLFSRTAFSAFLLNQSRWVRNGPSSYKDLLDALGVIALIVVLCEQVDQWKDGLSFRRAAPSDLPPQRDTSEPSHFYRHTRETRDIRQVCLGSPPFSFCPGRPSVQYFTQ